MGDVKHPLEEQLVLFADGELEAAKANTVREHLSTCWQCRTRVNELTEAISEFVRYRDHFIVPPDVEPPRPWLDIRAHLAEADQSADLHRSWKGSLRSFLRPVWALSIVAVLTGAALAWIGYIRISTNLRTERAVSSHAPETRIDPNAADPAAVPNETTKHQKASKTSSKSVTTGASEELQVIASLHRIGADLGDPISVERDGANQLVVKGVGLTPERRAQVETALSTIRSIRTEFQDVKVAPPRNEGTPSGIAAAELPWQDELDRVFDGRVNVEQSSILTLQHSDAMLARAHALENLERRFPGERVESLSAQDRHLLQATREDLLRGIQTSTAELRKQMQPLLTTGNDATVRVPMSRFQHAQQVDSLLNIILAGAQTDRTYSDLVAELAVHLRVLSETNR